MKLCQHKAINMLLMHGNSVITKTQCEMLVNPLICSDCCYSYMQ